MQDFFYPFCFLAKALTYEIDQSNPYVYAVLKSLFDTDHISDLIV